VGGVLLLLLLLLLLMGSEKAQVSTTCGPWDWVILRVWPAEMRAWVPVRAGRVGMVIVDENKLRVLESTR